MTYRALVVDDTAIFRKVISEALSSVPGIEVVGTASNGALALAKIQSSRPDLVFLDIEMPEMNGFEVLQAIRDQKIDVTVVMVSAFTRHGSAMTIRALELGAFDFITKSTDGSIEQNREKINSAVSTILKAYTRQREIQSILRGKPTPAAAAPTAAAPRSPTQPARLPEIQQRMEKLSRGAPIDMVVLGISTGGPNALAQMLPRLPADLNVPVLIVQHMPPLFTKSLAESLDGRCALRVKEAEDGEIALPNYIYIAPGGRQMKVTNGADGKIMIQITDDPPENNCRPSADTLFRSVAHHFPGRACGVIMTGMGNDGTMGLRLMKRNGARVIAQDETSCVVFGMPKEAIEAGVVDTIVPLNDIAGEIRKAIQGM